MPQLRKEEMMSETFQKILKIFKRDLTQNSIMFLLLDIVSSD